MRIFISSLVLCIVSCTSKTKPATLIIDIANLEAEKLTISGYGYKKEVDVNTGTISDTFHISESGIYSLRARGVNTDLYLSPGDKVSIVSNVKSFDDSLKVKGPHENIQKYLASKKETLVSTFTRDMYDLEPAEYLIKLAEGKKVMIDQIATVGLDQEFADMEKANIDYRLLKYKVRYPLYADKDINTLGEEFQKAKTAVDMHDENEYLKSKEYRELVDDHFMVSMYGDTTKEYEVAFQDLIKDMPTGNIKNQLLYGDIKYMLSPNEKLEETYKFFTDNSTNVEHKEKIAEQYQKLQKLGKGNASPYFNYKNYLGGNTTLKDLAGKYVYVDVWATWCGPCIGEIPSLKKVEHDYHDKNIEFVSISIDNPDDEQKWRDMIAKRKLGGEQLMADQAWESKFVSDYMINGIPRFILIDPEGNIVNADAPRPSEEGLRNLLDGLKI